MFCNQVDEWVMKLTQQVAPRRNAGVPEDMIEEATLASRQRRAIEHLKDWM